MQWGGWESLRCGLLQRDGRSNPAAPPLVLEHELLGKPIELLGVALLSNPLPSEEDRLHVLLF